MKFEVDKFYECLLVKEISAVDCDLCRVMEISAGQVARCVGFEFRKIKRNRGRYAKFMTRKDGIVFAFYERVSSNDIGSGTWFELEPLVVLARNEETGAL